MIINVEYLLRDQKKNITFTNDDFLRATGFDWRRANKMLRLQYVKQQMNEHNDCFFWL